jgi:hypothetical protein
MGAYITAADAYLGFNILTRHSTGRLFISSAANHCIRANLKLVRAALAQESIALRDFLFGEPGITGHLADKSAWTETFCLLLATTIFHPLSLSLRYMRF